MFVKEAKPRDDVRKTGRAPATTSIVTSKAFPRKNHRGKRNNKPRVVCVYEGTTRESVIQDPQRLRIACIASNISNFESVPGTSSEQKLCVPNRHNTTTTPKCDWLLNTTRGALRVRLYSH
mmetsp:Transcript_29101/g.62367  ORF Transcript_29101/g.62367 Transcript_29101/m.62367 type:complete len:121 (+) Transcript_29101:3255-3617(+)